MDHQILEASAKVTSVLEELDRLTDELLKAYKYLKSEGHPGLVNLKSALKRARRLRNQIRKKPKERIPFGETIDAINFIVSVTKLIYSLLNCMNPKEGYYEHWVYHNTAAYRRRPFSDWISPSTSCVQGLLVTS